MFVAAQSIPSAAAMATSEAIDADGLIATGTNPSTPFAEVDVKTGNDGTTAERYLDG